MKDNEYSVVFPIFWGKHGKLKARLAAKADAGFRYITASVPQMVKAGLLPNDHGLEHGDYFAVLLEGDIFLQFKLNRKNGATAAVHLPAPFELPPLDATGFQVKEYGVTVIGPMAQARLVAPQDGQVDELRDKRSISVSEPAAEKTSILDGTPTCFEILGLPEDAIGEEVKAAFRELVKIHHPDVGGSSDAMVTINTAYGEAMAELASREFQTPKD